MMRVLVVLVLVVSAAWSQTVHLSESEVRAAVEEGRLSKEQDIGVRLDRHYLMVFTPREWVKWQAHKAEKRYVNYNLSDLDTRKLFHVLDTPSTPRSIRDVRSVIAVVLKSKDKKLVVKPVETTRIETVAGNLIGAEVNYHGLHAMFSMEDVQRVRVASPDEEFVVTSVVHYPSHGRSYEYNVLVKRKHFERLQ